MGCGSSSQAAPPAASSPVGPAVGDLKTLVEMRSQCAGLAKAWPAGGDPVRWPGVTVKGNSKVTALSLSGVDLSGGVPPALLQLKNLDRLELRECRLRSLPPELWRLEKLGRVELSGNQIAQVPPEVTSARALRVLDLRGNPIGESSKKLQIALDDAKVQLSVDPDVKFA